MVESVFKCSRARQANSIFVITNSTFVINLSMPISPQKHVVEVKLVDEGRGLRRFAMYILLERGTIMTVEPILEPPYSTNEKPVETAIGAGYLCTEVE
jgi:hypothetical protein